MNRKEAYLQDLKDTKNLYQMVRCNSIYLKKLLEIVKEVYYCNIDLGNTAVTVAITNTDIDVNNPLGILIDIEGNAYSIDAINQNNALITYRFTLPAGPQGEQGPKGDDGEGVPIPIEIPDDIARTWKGVEDYLNSQGYPTPNDAVWGYYINITNSNTGQKVKGYITRRYFGTYCYTFVSEIYSNKDNATDNPIYSYDTSNSGVGGDVNAHIFMGSNFESIEIKHTNEESLISKLFKTTGPINMNVTIANNRITANATLSDLNYKITKGVGAIMSYPTNFGRPSVYKDMESATPPLDIGDRINYQGACNITSTTGPANVTHKLWMNEYYDDGSLTLEIELTLESTYESTFAQGAVTVEIIYI